METLTYMELRTVVIIDYQNVHLTGHGLFTASKYLPKHEALIDPLHFANQLIIARNQAQKSQWERDRRVSVHLRPLKYRYERDTEGHPLVGEDGTVNASSRARTRRGSMFCARSH